MQDDVTKLSSHLRGRDANIDRLSDTCAEMERRLRDEALRREQLNAELQTASTHLTALRIQRKSASREQGMETGSTDRLVRLEKKISNSFFLADKLVLLAIFIISQRFAHLFKWACSGRNVG